MCSSSTPKADVLFSLLQPTPWSHFKTKHPNPACVSSLPPCPVNFKLNPVTPILTLVSSLLAWTTYLSLARLIIAWVNSYTSLSLSLSLSFTVFLSLTLSLSTQAPITKYHRLWLQEQKLISHSFRGWKSNIQVLTGLIPGEDSSLLADGTYLLWWHLLFPWWEGRESKLSGVYSYKSTNPIMRVLPLRLHLNLIISQKPHLQISFHWGVRTSTYELGHGGEHNSIQSIVFTLFLSIDQIHTDIYSLYSLTNTSPCCCC